MKRKISQILRRKKKQAEKRLARKHYADQERPMFQASNIIYDLAEKTSAVVYGGIGAIHRLVRKLKLDQAINQEIRLLKSHVPYYESDHVLNMTYNLLCGGTHLEDLERLRQDENYAKGLGAERIPDPTTAGDFLRRFKEEDVGQLQEVINTTRQKIWDRQGESFHQEAILDVDGTIAGTTGECKEGMDRAYNGEWGYAPLLISLAQTKEVLYLVNRPGNRPSSDGAAEWIDRAIGLVRGKFEKIWLRGDTDFSMTGHLDRWDAQQVGFVLGYDACPNLKSKAEALPERAWSAMQRPARYEVQTSGRERPEKVKERIVRQREYTNIRLQSEHVAEFEYQPTQCRRKYRMVVLRKNLSIEKGIRLLFDDIRYFFFITNDRERSAQEVVLFANDRCNQENLIGQLKSGVHALGMPSNGLVSNWAYMVMAALAWNLKAWYGMIMPEAAARQAVLRMEFKRFLQNFLLLPCQIVNSGRRIVFRIITYSTALKDFFVTWERIRTLSFP